MAKYIPPVRYTVEELRAHLIADCQNDLAFSLREHPQDDPKWEAYREGLREKIANLVAGGPDPDL
jgi:hypothetical protein